ncbi:hypothetical protein ATM97_27775 [Nocardia sp. MH4]|uniref:hypothetical protein n=1 Tax=Nocardia sp. MH4 TaxID=1768677 RepID=UPI001C4F0906|nr:hypothetical protein [Nocardia sp. MH4]MBW0275004.1 hypothetical protein [Nocardia sp. MH4]
MTEPIPTQPEPEAPPAAQTAPLSGEFPEVPAAAPPDLSASDKDEIIAKLRRENASWRTKVRDLEPKATAHDEAVEAQKSEVQRALDRATAAEQTAAQREQELNLLRAAAKHGIPEEDHDLLGSGTPEELEARAARIAAMRQTSAPTPPPPSDRPVEGLRPGASPTPPVPVDTSYPAAWRPTGTTERS